MEYYGGGAGRSVSFADLILRRCGISNMKNSSGLVLGVLKVKGDWQVEFPEDMFLQAICEEESERAEAVMHALQEVRIEC